MTATKRVVRDGELDLIAIEEPLEIRVDGEPIAVTMRTPVTTRSWRWASSTARDCSSICLPWD